ncbi:MAG: helix-turn-helix transcriptional regulator [Streptosporangiaceae bacterium]|nr:helix-turn-helix transcriptional regulator [Streptosporangiaceae bacterium]
MANDRYIRNDLSAWLGEELRRVRLAAGYHSQDQLAHKLGFDRTVITKIETGKRPASDDAARVLVTTFPGLAGGRFAELSEIARRERGVIPGWFADWIEAERMATVIKMWEPLLVPGLLQTPEYARALFIAWQTAGTEDELEGLLSTRMARQAIFDRAGPPKFWAVIDETALHRRIGGPKVMRDQLLKLVELSERPRIAVHVIPADAGAHIGLLGAFAIADFDDDTADIVYMESPDEGHSTRNPATVAKVNLIFDTLRSEALPRGASRDLIVKVAEERWT